MVKFDILLSCLGTSRNFTSSGERNATSKCEPRYVGHHLMTGVLLTLKVFVQPMVDPIASCIAIFNGFIYEFFSMRRERKNMWSL